MTPIELIAEKCAANLEMLKMSVADFSEADMLVRPCPNANHAAWQIGHLVNSEATMINGCQPGTVPPLPPEFAEKLAGTTAKIDDPMAFATKGELLELLGKARAATVKWVRSLSAEDLSKPSPKQMRDYAPTVGHVVLLLSEHLAMHLGQMQVVRRKLGKPVLF